MNKIVTIVYVVLALAVAASAANGHANQCVPEPVTMLALIPGIGMLLRRRANKA